MARVQHVSDERAAASLADLLNGTTRARPFVVVTIPAGRAEPWIDVDEIAREAGDLAEVYVIPTGPLTWAFSGRMAEGTQVYGGAGRVYPVGHEWATDLAKSPLRFAFGAGDREHATRQLISDTLRMANSAGLLRSRPTPDRRRVRGVVNATIAGRALVDIGNVLPAAIAEELTIEDVPIERLFTAGQQVEGWFDPARNRLDVTESLRPGAEALSTYTVGDVVLAQVSVVRDDRAELVLYPKVKDPAVSVTVQRVDVTTNPLDDLRALMTVGEVIAARVAAAGPRWELVLHDVEDDEPVSQAPALLVGGPPWLVEDDPADLEFADQEAVEPALPMPALPMPALPMPSGTPERVDHEPVVEEPGIGQVPPPARPRPTPALLDRNRPPPGRPLAPAGPSPSEFTQGLLLKIEALAAEGRKLREEQDQLRTQLRAVAVEREQLRYLLDQAERRANRAESESKVARARLRKVGNARRVPAEVSGPQFADREQGFRHLVLTRWATRTLPSEQAERPLPEYLIGPAFLDSLDTLEGIGREKVADVVVEIVTGLAAQLPGREVHQLRTGRGGADPVRTRQDGAVCWRASLQVRTPSARRIHYWVLPDKRIELAGVGAHDDVDT